MQSRAGKCQSSSQLGSISIDDGIDDPITRFTVVVAFHRSSFHLPIDSDAIQLNAITSNYDCILNIFGMMFGFKLILVSQRQLQSFLNRSKLAALGSNLTGFFLFSIQHSSAESDRRDDIHVEVLADGFHRFRRYSI